MARGKKIAILGAGHVGATIAFSLALEAYANEIVLIDINTEKAKGEAADISHGTVFTPDVNVYAGEYKDAKNADIVIATAGASRKPGQTRLELAQTNVNIIKTIIPEIVKYAKNAIYIIVSNPVDVITYTFCKLSGLPERQIIGSGTLLDTVRLLEAVAKHTGLPAENVQAYVLGEHGDTQVVPWSLVSVAGMKMHEYCEQVCARRKKCGKAELNDIAQDVKTSGGKIIAAKGATYYGIAASVRRLCETILRGSPCVHTVSTMLRGEYGISGVCLSLPFEVDGGGIKKLLKVPLTGDELELLHKSADALKNVIKNLNI